MEKELALALVVVIAGGLTINEANGIISEGSNRCCDVARNCPVGNGVCDCPADRIINPRGPGYCYSCDRINCISDA